jgi:outer membrane lipoprotein-sorting protein
MCRDVPDMTALSKCWPGHVRRRCQGAPRLSQNNAGISFCLKIAQRAATATSLATLLLLSACESPPKPRLTAADAADIDRVTTYLNSIPRFEAHFIQYGSFGPDSGVVWVDRPAGHLRIDYTSARVMVIANGQVQILDRGNGATTTMPVSSTPLGLLLTPEIDLSGTVTVESVVHQPGSMQVTLEKTGQRSRGSLTLTLAEEPLRLVAVTVTDREQRTLTMKLYRLDPAQTLTPGMFLPPTPSPDS